MANFWDFSVWGGFNLLAVLLISLIFSNLLKRNIRILRVSLIPTSVLAGIILLTISSVYQMITGKIMFDTAFFGEGGMSGMEIITYHALALGFIATTLKNSKNTTTGKRGVEIFNTGVTTVATYLLQAVVGFGITIGLSYVVKDFFPAAGVLLPFGYGQGTGQALNYGSIYETEYGFVGGKSFGLTIAALGFLSASIGGVIHLNILRKKGKITIKDECENTPNVAFQDENEIAINGSLDKLTVQLALIAIAYFAAYLLMYALGSLLPGMKSVIYGFNFLIGVLTATLLKAFIRFLEKKKIAKKQYTNNFLLDRIGNACFDVMVVAGIAAIRLDLLKQYWWILLLLGVVGLLITYFYVRFASYKLFPEYKDEQFLAMYGMLTGTASTGIILLREIDGEFKTPVADNLVYQNFPAIIFGFPLMFLATLAPKQTWLTLLILFIFFVVMNMILFRAQIFKKKKK